MSSTPGAKGYSRHLGCTFFMTGRHLPEDNPGPCVDPWHLRRRYCFWRAICRAPRHLGFGWPAKSVIGCRCDLVVTCRLTIWIQAVGWGSRKCRSVSNVTFVAERSYDDTGCLSRPRQWLSHWPSVHDTPRRQPRIQPDRPHALPMQPDHLVVEMPEHALDLVVTPSTIASRARWGPRMSSWAGWVVRSSKAK